MQNLCFKPRPGGKAVQLVRHVYDPARKRSRTLTLGTLDLTADPEDFPTGLSLRRGITLDAHEHDKIRAYAMAHADPLSCQKRMALVERIRNALQSTQATTVTDPFVQCAEAISTLTTALPELAETARAAGQDPWNTLRPSYLALVERWKSLLATAQTVGIAKQYKRGTVDTQADQ